MNRIIISDREEKETDNSTLTLSYPNANKMLVNLRSDHFKSVTLQNISNVETKNLKFLIQLNRILKTDVLILLSKGFVLLQGGENKQLSILLSRLNLF